MITIDYLILILYFIISFAIAIIYSRRSSKSTEEFFLSGRALPWYLAGLSMVATTFAADTPLAVTEMVANNGVSGNWLWWSFVFGGVLTVFFFAKLWRRAGIMTEAEFAAVRYSGKPARFLRGFKAVYLGLFMNVIIMGWVNSAMMKILKVMFNIPAAELYIYVIGCLLMVAIYSALSGLWGVVVTDAFQFILAMIGCIVLAVLVVNSGQIGGIAGMKAKLDAQAFNFFPTISSITAQGAGKVFVISLTGFLAYIGIQWWASWYPGAEPGGGGYVAQRIMSAKNEKHSVFAALFFQVAHYALRPWPWILVGLASLILYPQLAETEKGLGYVYAMRDYLPAGLKGLLVASFFAAYMSTISTQLNWGSSYLLNDLYRPFIAKQRSTRHYVIASQVIILLLMVISMDVTPLITRIDSAWKFILQCGAGLGGVLIFRWYWWRINVWSEISAMIMPFFLFPITSYFGLEFPENMFIIVFGTSLVWLLVTFITPPTDESILISFYRQVRPGGRLWLPVSRKIPDVASDFNFSRSFIQWLSGIVLVYSMLFSIGSIVLLDLGNALLWLLFVVLSAALLVYTFKKSEM